MATAPREPQDRKAPTKRAPRKTTPPVAEKTPVERLQAEAEALDADQWQVKELGDTGVTVRILNFVEWPRNIMRHLLAMDWEAIAWIVHPDDLEKWNAWDCKLGDLMEFGAYLVAEGSEDAGEALASRASSRSIRRR